MKLLFAIALVAISAGAQTNINRLRLSPAMERLNQSEFYSSKVDEFDRNISHWLHRNVIACGGLGPEVWFDARRFVAFDGFSQPRYTNQELIIVLDGKESDYVAIRDCPLQLMVDGDKMTIHPEKGAYHLSAKDGWVRESCAFELPDDAMRMIGQAQRVQMRFDGSNDRLDRTLTSTNIARIKVFVSTFIDQAKGGDKSGLRKPLAGRKSTQ